jgi:hypothetical protein
MRPADRLAGWYQDPADDELERFWDGDEWTGKSRPRPLLMPPPAKSHTSQRSKSSADLPTVVVVGYICAVLFPPLGFVLGLTQINQSPHGLRIVLASIALLVLYVWINT